MCTCIILLYHNDSVQKSFHLRYYSLTAFSGSDIGELLRPFPPSVSVSSMVLVEVTTANISEYNSSRLTPSSPAKLNIWNSRLHLSLNDPWVSTVRPHTNSSKSIEPFCKII